MKAFILCGSRDWTDKAAIGAVLDEMSGTEVVMIHGAARGADSIGAAHWGIGAVPMPAQWGRDGKAAGPIRNEAMLRVLLALKLCGYEVSVEAFSLPGSTGTKDMSEIAKAAGVVVNEHGRTA